jgi:hypothetical protein
MISINMDKAKAIGHDIRRIARAEAFKPLDELLMRQIPGTDTQVIEAERQDIRDKYAEVQIQIDASLTTDEIKEALA